MFVAEMDHEDYIYAHCYEDDDEGNEAGCGMEYELHPDGTLRRWHDAVGQVTESTITEGEWSRLVEWHERNCGIEAA